MDRWCKLCGKQPASLFMWQGELTPLCYECWEDYVGTGDEDGGWDDYRDVEEWADPWSVWPND